MKGLSVQAGSHKNCLPWVEAKNKNNNNTNKKTVAWGFLGECNWVVAQKNKVLIATTQNNACGGIAVKKKYRKQLQNYGQKDRQKDGSKED